MKISDYYTQVLRDHGVRYVFGLQGSGTAVQMFDSIARCDGIDYVCTLHEQAAGMAADGYAAVTGGLGACIVDSGPAATNLYTCVAGAYYNSMPILFIVAQPQTHLLRKNLKLRHYGYHEAELISGFSPVTKYITQITDPARVRYEIEKAIYLATTGRPGPVMLALPDDITWLSVEPDELERFFPDGLAAGADTDPVLDGKAAACVDLLKSSKRPILMLGSGVRKAQAVPMAKELIEKLGIPAALTFPMRDVLPDRHPLNIGSFGVQGTRAGNFAVQNADFILVLGARLDPYEIGQPAGNFARGANVAVVDIDPCELEKLGQYGIPCALAVNADLKDFIRAFDRQANAGISASHYAEWRGKVQMWRKKYPVFPGKEDGKEPINPYAVVEQLSLMLGDGDVVVTDTGSSRNYVFQTFACKENQRLISWLNFACLGYGLPAAIGACFAHDGRVVAVMGDGGLQFNIQELATAVYHHLNIKIILFDNNGYDTVRHTINNFLDSRYHAVSRETGLPIPDSAKIAAAYGLPVIEIRKSSELAEKLKQTLLTDGPVFCSIHLPENQWTTPVRKGKDPIEDLSPKLPREEFYREMIVPPVS